MAVDRNAPNGDDKEVNASSTTPPAPPQEKPNREKVYDKKSRLEFSDTIGKSARHSPSMSSISSQLDILLAPPTDSPAQYAKEMANKRQFDYRLIRQLDSGVGSNASKLLSPKMAQTIQATASLGILQFHRSVTRSYMRKELSLAYKRTATLGHMATTLTTLGGTLEAKLEAIKINTGRAATIAVDQAAPSFFDELMQPIKDELKGRATGYARQLGSRFAKNKSLGKTLDWAVEHADTNLNIAGRSLNRLRGRNAAAPSMVDPLRRGLGLLRGREIADDGFLNNAANASMFFLKDRFPDLFKPKLTADQIERAKPTYKLLEETQHLLRDWRSEQMLVLRDIASRIGGSGVGGGTGAPRRVPGGPRPSSGGGISGGGAPSMQESAVDTGVTADAPIVAEASERLTPESRVEMRDRARRAMRLAKIRGRRLYRQYGQEHVTRAQGLYDEHLRDRVDDLTERTTEAVNRVRETPQATAFLERAREMGTMTRSQERLFRRYAQRHGYAAAIRRFSADTGRAAQSQFNTLMQSDRIPRDRLAEIRDYARQHGYAAALRKYGTLLRETAEGHVPRSREDLADLASRASGWARSRSPYSTAEATQRARDLAGRARSAVSGAYSSYMPLEGQAAAAVAGATLSGMANRARRAWEGDPRQSDLEAARARRASQYEHLDTAAMGRTTASRGTTGNRGLRSRIHDIAEHVIDHTADARRNAAEAAGRARNAAEDIINRNRQGGDAPSNNNSSGGLFSQIEEAVAGLVATAVGGAAFKRLGRAGRSLLSRGVRARGLGAVGEQVATDLFGRTLGGGALRAGGRFFRRGAAGANALGDIFESRGLRGVARTAGGRILRTALWDAPTAPYRYLMRGANGAEAILRSPLASATLRRTVGAGGRLTGRAAMAALPYALWHSPKFFGYTVPKTIASTLLRTRLGRIGALGTGALLANGMDNRLDYLMGNGHPELNAAAHAGLGAAEWGMGTRALMHTIGATGRWGRLATLGASGLGALLHWRGNSQQTQDSARIAAAMRQATPAIVRPGGTGSDPTAGSILGNAASYAGLGYLGHVAGNVFRGRKWASLAMDGAKLGRLGAGGLASVAGMGADLINNKLVDRFIPRHHKDGSTNKWNTATRTTIGVAGNAIAGAEMGSMIGPWGTAIGAVVGGTYGFFKENPHEAKKLWKKFSSFIHVGSAHIDAGERKSAGAALDKGTAIGNAGSSFPSAGNPQSVGVPSGAYSTQTVSAGLKEDNSNITGSKEYKAAYAKLKDPLKKRMDKSSGLRYLLYSYAVMSGPEHAADVLNARVTSKMSDSTAVEEITEYRAMRDALPQGMSRMDYSNDVYNQKSSAIALSANPNAMSYYQQRVSAGATGYVGAPTPPKGAQLAGCKRVIDLFMQAKYPQVSAVSAAADVWRESNMNPGAVGDRGSPGGALGIAQWHLDRRRAIEAHFKKPMEQMSLDEQTQAMIWEIQTNPNNVCGGTQSGLMKAKTIEEAIAVLVDNFERPADRAGEKQKRAQMAHELMHIFFKSDGTATDAATQSAAGVTAGVNTAAAPASAGSAPTGTASGATGAAPTAGGAAGGSGSGGTAAAGGTPATATGSPATGGAAATTGAAGTAATPGTATKAGSTAAPAMGAAAAATGTKATATSPVANTPTLSDPSSVQNMRDWNKKEQAAAAVRDSVLPNTAAPKFSAAKAIFSTEAMDESKRLNASAEDGEVTLAQSYGQPRVKGMPNFKDTTPAPAAKPAAPATPPPTVVVQQQTNEQHHYHSTSNQVSTRRTLHTGG